MNGLSEDDSSDSSNEFLVDPDKINLNSSFFAKKKRKAKNVIKSDTDESSDDDIDINQMNGIELFTDILKELESTKKFEQAVENVENKQIFTHSVTPQKEKKAPQLKKEVKETTTSNEIAELLLQGESSVSPSSKGNLTDTIVKDEENEEANTEYSIPKEGVKITVPSTSMILKKSKKGGQDYKAVLRRILRTSQILVEKVGLLCWLAYGFNLNRKVNEPEVMAASLSLISSNKYPKGRIDLSYLEKFTKFYKNIFKFEAVESNGNKRINKETLLKAIEEKKVSDYRELVLLYVAALRALGLNCRVVISLCPPHRIFSDNPLFKMEKKDEPDSSKTKSNAAKSKATSKSSKKKASDKPVMILNSPEAKKNANAEAKKRAAEVLRSKSQMDGKKIKLDTKAKSSITKSNDNEKKSEDVKEEKTVSSLRQLRSRKVVTDSKDNKTEKSTDESSKSDGTKSKYYMDEDSTDTETEFQPKPKRVVKRNLNRTDEAAQSSKSSTKNNKKLSSGTEDKEILHSKPQMNGKMIKLDTKAAKGSSTKSNDDEKKSEDVKEEKIVSSLRQLRSRKVVTDSKDNKTEKSTDESSKSDDTKSIYYMDEDSADSEAEFQPKPKRVAKGNLNRTDEVAQSSKSSTKNNRKLLSSDSEDEETNKSGKSQDIWAEVFLESEESWICASVMDEKIHCVSEVYKKAKKPVLYVVAWNQEGLIKDVTRRYCPRWLTVTRKQRVDQKWWSETMSYWKEKDTAISRAEDEMLLLKDLEQPLPKTIGECKGHPLYVIQRHLLKFEALYPPDCVPLGHLPSGDAIYSRHCVHTCRSRETWLKEAKVVKPNQEPYKIVKGRKKYDKLSGMKIKDSALEIFGEWQTMDYEPPEAKDGIVPRNEFGNVDLFKQRMLPKGTVHIKLPGLSRIARKLNIDCPQAVVGFNHGCMGSVPDFEGYVVCSEYEDVLREAWEAEQVEAAKRAREKRENRVYENWKKLIKGLLIRERLTQKYEFTGKVKSVATNKLKKKRCS